MKEHHKLSLVLGIITIAIFSMQNDNPRDEPPANEEAYSSSPPGNARGWDYQNNRWLTTDNKVSRGKELIMSDSDIERIRRDLPPGYYLYTPGNPYKYQSTDEKIEAYIEDNIDEIMENYDH